MTHSLSSYRRCTGCSKKRSLRSNTFFAEFPKIALSKLLLAIYYFLQDDPQHRAARALDFKPPLVSKIFRRLQDVCSVDLENRPFIPFGGPGTVAKCDESKFNHRPKVNISTLSHYHIKGTSRGRVIPLQKKKIKPFQFALLCLPPLIETGLSRSILIFRFSVERGPADLEWYLRWELLFYSGCFG